MKRGYFSFASTTIIHRVRESECECLCVRERQREGERAREMVRGRK